MPLNKGFSDCFFSVQQYRGAILGGSKICISGWRCCIFASRSQAAPQHNFWKQVFKFCIRFALTLLCEVRRHLSIALESKLSSLCIRFALTLLREVRRHLSIALESKLSSLCIRFALTLLREVRLHLSIALESKLYSLCIRFALTFAQNKQLRHNNAGSNVKIILNTYLCSSSFLFPQILKTLQWGWC